MKRQPRQHDDSHLQWTRQLPCVICKDDTTTEAAHVRMPDITVAKPLTGTGIKPDDKYVLPLCGAHHRDQHQMNEADFWDGFGIDPVKLSLALYAVSGDHEAGEHIIRTFYIHK